MAGYKRQARTAIIYADSGDTKTTQLYHMARWYLKRNPNKKVRLITADGGGWAPFDDDPTMIASGRVDAWNIIDQPKSYSLLMALSEGYWPKRGSKTGKLIFKREDAYKAETESGDVGMLLIEGLTPIAKLWEGHLAHSEQAGFKHSWTFEEDEYSVGGLQPGHYGLVQNELFKLINKGFNRLPFDYVIWTARVSKGTNRQGETEYGPKGSGDAQTTEYPAWFMDCIHLDTEQTENGLAKVAWFQNHYDDKTNLKYPAKVRILPHLMPQLLDEYPDGYIKLGFKRGLDVLFEKIEKANKEYEKSLVVAEAATGDVTE